MAGPPPSGGCLSNAGTGETTTTGCGSATVCQAGISNYISFSTITAPDSDGRWNVQFKTNSCPHSPSSGSLNGTYYGLKSNACCVSVNLPVNSKVSPNALATSLRGTIGFSLHGAKIYGPMEAGFSLGMACDNGKGTCNAGLDVRLCAKSLVKQCGASHVKYGMLLDTCGGHASPYHFHESMRCEYAYNSSSTGHSDLIGIMLDGRGIYGQYEGTGGALPTLDACGGHVGNVPEQTIQGATGAHVFPAATNVYHYHVVDGGPTTIGCYGPVADVPTAKALYAECGTGFENVCTCEGNINYDLDCPVFNQQGTGATYNLDIVPTSTCNATFCTGGGGFLKSTSPSVVLFLLVVYLLCIVKMR